MACRTLGSDFMTFPKPSSFVKNASFQLSFNILGSQYTLNSVLYSNKCKKVGKVREINLFVCLRFLLNQNFRFNFWKLPVANGAVFSKI